MYSLIYRSVASPDVNIDHIRNILEESRTFNRAHNITGCLLHHRQKFIQLIEGPKNSVLSLFKKIEKDGRHNNVKVLHRQYSPIRMFGEWNMIFDDIDSDKSGLQVDKREHFESIFHSSDAVCNPGYSKLALWTQANAIFVDNDVA